ncbi:agamous-like MADS-box protein AGL103 [Diospyros lotus]|uniref:agamous-like MADS-box protein AGL103 n=1 Tax=Diospyros lotus TaxID=55363 RepID=UPI00225A50EF|nr:agamous-like MADS-box protein AGL103 [Diospyros lotus]
MGRAKLQMELISDKKNCYRTFIKRNKGLTKKAYELKTLCSVDVCLIVYGPKLNERPSDQEEIWPRNRDEIQALIESYRKQSAEDRRRRTNDLSNFFEDRNKKAEETLMKLRKKNDEAKYPTWNDRYNDFSKEELRQFGAIVEKKLQEVKARVAAFANNQDNLLQDHHFYDMTMIHHHPLYDLQAAPGKGMSLHQLQANSYDSMVNPVMMVPLNENNNHYMSGGGGGGSSSSTHLHHDHELLLGGASSSSNFPVCYDPATAIGYYSFSIPAGAMVPYVQLPMIPGAPNSHQVHAPHHEIDDYYEVDEFHMKHQN